MDQLFHTLQDRLLGEPRSGGIATIKAANRFLVVMEGRPDETLRKPHRAM